MTLRHTLARPAATTIAVALLTALISTVLVAVPAQAAPTPTVVVSKTEGLDGAGETITVTGSGFVPAEDGSTSGTRPPLAGQFGGAYVVFGKFADEWQPSAGAPSSARPVTTQKWALDAAAPESLRSITIGSDGTFTAQFTVSDSSPDAPGNYGIYTYSGSGSTYAPFETATPLTFAEPEPEPAPTPSAETTPAAEPTPAPSVSLKPAPEPSVTPAPTPEGPVQASVSVKNDSGLVDGDEITITGSGFVENDPATTATRAPLCERDGTSWVNCQFGGAYVIFGQFADDWKPSDGAPSSARDVTAQRWALTDSAYAGAPDSFKPMLDSGGRFTLNDDGTFSVTMTIDREGADTTGNWGIYTYAAGGPTYAPFETFTPLNFAPNAAVEVSQASDLLDGDEITITGSGFVENDPATTATRAPLCERDGTSWVNCQFGGAYVIFGQFADDWKPSDGAPSSARDVTAQRWALTDSAYAGAPDSFKPMLDSGGRFTLNDDGTFSVTMTIDREGADTTGNWGIYTYAAGGPTYAPFETFTPLAFLADEDAGGGDDGDDNEVVIPVPTSGDLNWGVRESWRDYIGNSGITVSAGASKNTDGTFRFAPDGGTLDVTKGTGTAKFKGEVRFEHSTHGIDITFSDPNIRLTSTTQGVLSVVRDGSRIDLVTLNLGAADRTAGDASVTYTKVPTTLLKSGQAIFDGFYETGVTFDPLTVTLGASKPTSGSGDGTGNTGNEPDKNPAKPGKGTPPATPAPKAGVAGSLSWGVDSDFRDYITNRGAKGSISVQGARASAGVFTFGQSGGNLNASAGTGTAQYSGAVTFNGHGGALNLRFSNPQVRMTGTSRAMLSVSVNGSRVDFASLNLAAANRSTQGEAVRFSGAPATLTPAGARAFMNFYPAGRSLAPVSFTFGDPAPAGGGGVRTVASAVSTTADGIPDTPPATTGIDIDDQTLAQLLAGEVVTLEVPGFEPNEQDIKVVVYSTPTVLATDVTANANGVASWTGSLPASLTGEHTLTFQGSSNYGIVLNIPDRSVGGMCVVDSSDLSWGFKEGFRSYLESPIADGDWTLDGVTEVGGEYVWSGGDGALDTEALTGALNYAGSIQFQGHGDVLNTTIANPIVELSGDGAYLLMDVTGTTQDGQPVSQTGIRFAELDLDAGTVDSEGNVVTFTGIPATLTDAGSDAFGTYPGGEALDPVTFTLTSADDCVLALTGEAPEPTDEPTGEPVDEPTADTTVTEPSGDAGTPWWAWVLVVAAVISTAALVVIAARRKK